MPTGFSHGSTGTAEKGRKGDKKTFYCNLCYIELNSEDTKISHERGVKHVKKAQISSQEYLERGEDPPEFIKPIPNPESAKKKIPIRLHKKLKEANDPAIGLEFVIEYLPETDPEMDPQYECELCGNKGIANGMLSHVMGHTHRKNVMYKAHPGDKHYFERNQKECLEYAAAHAENNKELSLLIRTIRSDDLYPWPAGKAPWSIENGGSGIPPHNAKENFGMNKFNGTLTENKFKPDPGLSDSRGVLPSPDSVLPPRTSMEAEMYIALANKLIQHTKEYLPLGLKDKLSLQARGITDQCTMAIRKQAKTTER